MEEQFFSEIISKHVAAIEAEVAGVRENKDIECLHRMRVALRRLKSALSDFKGLIDERDYQQVVLGINKLLRVLGQARDMDTKIAFLKVLVDDPSAKRYREGILEIIDELSEDRNEVQPKIIKYLARIKRRKVLRSALRLRPIFQEAGITLDEWTKNRILVRLQKLFSLEPYVRRPNCVRELHEMRIAAKNLRYSLENFQELHGRRSGHFSSSAAQVQRCLGDVHNFDVWLNLVKIFGDSSGREPSFRKAVTFLRKECESRRLSAYRDFLKLWTGLKRRKTWARLSFFALDRK